MTVPQRDLIFEQDILLTWIINRGGAVTAEEVAAVRDRYLGDPAAAAAALDMLVQRCLGTYEEHDGERTFIANQNQPYSRSRSKRRELW